MRRVALSLVLAPTACSGGNDTRQVTTSFASVSSTTPTTTVATDATGDATTNDAGSDTGTTEPATSADSSGEPGPRFVARGTVIDFGTLDMPTIDDANVRVFGDPDTATSTQA